MTQIDFKYYLKGGLPPFFLFEILIPEHSRVILLYRSRNYVHPNENWRFNQIPPIKL